LDHLRITEVVGEIVNTVDGISLSLDFSFSFWCFSLGEWGGPVVGWFWGIIVVIVTSKFTVLSVMDIINVVSINISFDLI